MQTFWLFQTFLHDLSSNPQSDSFKTCRRIYNKVQRIVFGASEPARREKINENVLPVTVLGSLILAGVAVPFLPRHAGPLAVAQARRPRPAEDTISDAPPIQQLGRSNTVAGGPSKTRRKKSQPSQGLSDTENHKRLNPSTPGLQDAPEFSNGQIKPARTKNKQGARPSMLTVVSPEARLSSSSLPDFRKTAVTPTPSPPQTATLPQKGGQALRRRHSHISRPLSPSAIPRSQKIRLLRSNYFRSQTQFLLALEDVSNRLVAVPKPARLSALRAELALIAQDLPSEVDIPVICPAVLEDGSAGRSRHHRVVRLNPAEATSLNSAERVPYLVLVEVLREDFDFNPDSDVNTELLTRLLAEKGTPRKRLFDITDASRAPLQDRAGGASDSVFEPANGDLGSSSLIRDLEEGDVATAHRPKSPFVSNALQAKVEQARSSSGANTLSSRTTISTPRTSDMDSRSGSPAPHRGPAAGKPQPADQPDFTALATHMRTAAQMLAQLNTSGAKRPKVEVDAIKAKIIASMQSLEEQNFYTEDSGNASFDKIMANANAVAATAEPEDFEENLEATTDPNSSTGAGVNRMENDMKTGGISRKGDRDDPSAANFGEDWTAKRERIRRSSPYGWMKNWDLVSVIVKTGADLRQEAFACQLIQVCSKIWQDTDTPVWVKRMRILVTGESSGLIETIANGISLHSIKRSLTLASIASGNNPRKRIATLRDHFIKAFGDVESEAYAAAVDAFARSLAAYSIISYVLQIKDRHNGNILIDNSGHVVHIDFGFMLSNSPGSMGFEAAPFKFTQEYIDVLGGPGAPAYDHFKQLCKQAFQALRKEAERIIMLVDLMSKQSKMACFAAGGPQSVSALRSRFVLQMSREEAENYVEDLVAKSAGSYYTRL